MENTTPLYGNVSAFPTLKARLQMKFMVLQIVSIEVLSETKGKYEINFADNRKYAFTHKINPEQRKLE